MNPILTKLPETDPAQLLRYRDRQFAAELMAVALLHLDLFSWLAQNAGATESQIREHFAITPRPTDVLLSLLRSNHLIRTDADGRNFLTDLGREHLTVSSPWYLGPYYEPLRGAPAYEGYIRVLETGKPANWQAQADGEDWHESMLDESFAKGFTALMNSRGTLFGQFLAKAVGPRLGQRKRMLDVGGGSGIYSTTMVAKHPQLECTVLEQKPVDEIARLEIAKHGLSQKVSVLSGDMFKIDWPACDIVLLSNVLHDWDFPEVRTLLAKATRSLPSGGLVIVHEAFLNDSKTGPLPVAEYSTLLMHITQGKCYTPNEYGEILESLGFDVAPYENTISDRGFMTAVKR